MYQVENAMYQVENEMSQVENAMSQVENAMVKVENAMSCAASRPQLTLPAVSSATSALPEPCLPPNPIRLLVFPYFQMKCDNTTHS